MNGEHTMLHLPHDPVRNGCLSVDMAATSAWHWTVNAIQGILHPHTQLRLPKCD